MKQLISALSLVILLACVDSNSQADDIDQLMMQATDESRGGAERADALDRLANIDAARAEQLAVKYVQDPALPLALTATQLLADSIVMSNHTVSGQGSLTERQKDVMKRHKVSREALYPALTDSRKQVRGIAARILTSLSDERALQSIQSGVESGLYKDIEAVNYYGLANAKTGEPYVKPYLENGSIGARQSAIQYLGRNSAYQEEVRTKVLFDATEDPRVRATAATILGTYDVNFTIYASDLANSTELPNNVYSEVVKQFLDKKPNITAEGKKSMQRAMKIYLDGAGNDKKDLDILDRRIKTIQPSPIQ